MKTAPPTKRLSDSEEALLKALQLSPSDEEKLKTALQKALQRSIEKTYPATWLADINNKLETIKEAYARSKDTERDRQLLGALNLCGTFRPLPEWLCTALREPLVERLSQSPTLHWIRWHLVLALREDAKRRQIKLSWTETYKRASERLVGTDAKGGPETIKKSYLIAASDYRRMTAKPG
jgi:hypothetical protein